MPVFLATNRTFDGAWTNTPTPRGEIGLFRVENAADLAGSGLAPLTLRAGIGAMMDAALAAAAAPGGRQRHAPLLVACIHGYNTTLDAALQRTAAIQAGLAAQGLGVAALCFAWPSDGNVTQYLSDRADALLSAPAVVNLMAALNQFGDLRQCPVSICVAAHSMGCLLLREGLNQFSRQLGYPENYPLLSETALIAADVDAATMERGGTGAGIAALSRRVTVYYNRADSVLAASQFAKNAGSARLGRNGPADFISLERRVVAVDCSAAIRPDSDLPVVDFIEGLTEVHAGYFNPGGPFWPDLAYTFAGVDRTIIPTRRAATTATDQSYCLKPASPA